MGFVAFVNISPCHNVTVYIMVEEKLSFICETLTSLAMNISIKDHFPVNNGSIRHL